jgi:flavin-dependent dehydrogenase
MRGEHPVETMSFERDVDVLCVGSGAGGMSAAITAAEAGLRTLVVEKDDKAGGVQALSSGQIWLGADWESANRARSLRAISTVYRRDSRFPPCGICSSIAATTRCAFSTSASEFPS